MASFSQRDLSISALLLLAAAVVDEKVQNLALGVLRPSALEGDPCQHLVAPPVEANHLRSEQ
jgi:hypothetical protein